MDYNLLSDEDIVLLIRQGDYEAEEFLTERYIPLVKKISRKFFLIGGEAEDLIQEGTIGLVSAVRKYSSGLNCPFSAFAGTCIKNRIISEVRSSSGARHAPLNSSISLEELDESFFSEFVSGSAEDYLIADENRSELVAYINKKLSRLEKKVLYFYLDGLSYSQIGLKLGKDVKSIDNSVQRIRKKLSYILSA